MGAKIKNVIAHINSMSNKKNISLILSYHNYLIDKGIVVNSQINNIKPIYYFAKHLDTTNLTDVKDKLTITTFLNTLIKYDDQDKKYLTTWNYYLEKIKGFYRWVYNNDESNDARDWTTPDFIKIRKKQTKRLSPYSGTEIWEKEELISVIKYETSVRNKAIISLLWDLDARPHEVTLLKIKHVRLKEKYGEGEIPFSAKTGSGPILLTFSFPYVRDWLNQHPDRNNGEAPLICTKKDGTAIITGFIYDMMDALKVRIKRLVISGAITDQREKERLEYFLNTKKWNPYCIRHSAITADSDYLPEYALKKKVRWSMNSQQGRRYIKNRMGDELRNKILEQNGIILDTELKPKPTNTICPRCELVNQLENKFCSKCSYPLSPQAFEEIKNEENAKLKALEDKQNKQIEDMQEKLKTIMKNVDFNKLKLQQQQKAIHDP
jgi:integrase/recombinase XerD